MPFYSLFTIFSSQSNYGGISCTLPRDLRSLFEEEEEEVEDVEEVRMEEDEEEKEVEMKWSLSKYLPEAASCQEIFKVLVAGHIRALYTHSQEQLSGHASGTTPVRRRVTASQTQVSMQ